MYLYHKMRTVIGFLSINQLIAEEREFLLTSEELDKKVAWNSELARRQWKYLAYARQSYSVFQREPVDRPDLNISKYAYKNI